MATTTPTSRPLSTIAADIRVYWPNPSPNALPYIDALATLSSINDCYGHDDAHSIVLYLLSNSTSWRGPDARRIKAELRSLLPS